MTEEQKTKNHYEMLNNSSNKALVDLIKMQDNKIEQLEKENAELRKEWQEQVQKATDEGYARTLQTIQLTKAKDLLQKVADICGYPNYDIPVVLYSEIADFLKENSTYERIQKAKYNYTD